MKKPELYNQRAKIFIEYLVESGREPDKKELLRIIGINNINNYYTIGTNENRNFTVKQLKILIEKYKADPAFFFIKSHSNMILSAKPKTAKQLLREAIILINE